MGDPKYVTEFIKEVYPDSTALAMTANTEKDCLVDATALIRELRAEVAELKLECKGATRRRECLLADLRKLKLEAAEDRQHTRNIEAQRREWKQRAEAMQKAVDAAKHVETMVARFLAHGLHSDIHLALTAMFKRLAELEKAEKKEIRDG